MGGKGHEGDSGAKVMLSDGSVASVLSTGDEFAGEAG
jgi:hypothetical protein